MIIYDGPGDLFSTRVETIVCSINTIGAMGKGIALRFKNEVPGLYDYYRSIYKDVPPDYPSKNRLEIFACDFRRKVLLFPTKTTWREPSKLDLIEENLIKLAAEYEQMGIHSLALPLIGCGVQTGQLDWRDVGELVYKYLDPLPIPVSIVSG